MSQLAGRPTAFVVVSPRCSSCHTLLQQLAEGSLFGDATTKWMVVSTGDAAGTLELLRSAGVPADDSILLDTEGAVASKWGVNATPVTVYVDEALTVVRQGIGALAPGQSLPVMQPNDTARDTARVAQPS